VIGSTADRTIRTAPCPVLTVKKPRPARAEEAA
jgi:nucleotide-binding universal stress UspA family protein